MLRILACGCGLDSSRANTMPSTRKSSAYFASPVIFATTSWGMKSCPRCLCATMDLLRPAGRAHHRIEVVVVGTAAAQVAGHGQPRFLARGRRILLQQRHGGDHLARRAEATLRTQLVDESLLYRMQFAVGAAQALDGDHLAAAHAVRE